MHILIPSAAVITKTAHISAGISETNTGRNKPGDFKSSFPPGHMLQTIFSELVSSTLWKYSNSVLSGTNSENHPV